MGVFDKIAVSMIWSNLPLGDTFFCDQYMNTTSISLGVMLCLCERLSVYSLHMLILVPLEF